MADNQLLLIDDDLLISNYQIVNNYNEIVFHLPGADFMQLNKNKVEKKLSIVVLLSFIGFAFSLFVSWEITAPAIRAVMMGQELPAGSTWIGIICCDLLLFIGGAAFCWNVVSQSLVEITDIGISQKCLLSDDIFISWQQITRIAVQNSMGKPHLIDIESNDKVIRINCLYYKDSAKLISLIQ